MTIVSTAPRIVELGERSVKLKVSHSVLVVAGFYWDFLSLCANTLFVGVLEICAPDRIVVFGPVVRGCICPFLELPPVTLACSIYKFTRLSEHYPSFPLAFVVG